MSSFYYMDGTKKLAQDEKEYYEWNTIINPDNLEASKLWKNSNKATYRKTIIKHYSKEETSSNILNILSKNTKQFKKDLLDNKGTMGEFKKYINLDSFDGRNLNLNCKKICPKLNKQIGELTSGHTKPKFVSKKNNGKNNGKINIISEAIDDLLYTIIKACCDIKCPDNKLALKGQLKCGSCADMKWTMKLRAGHGQRSRCRKNYKESLWIPYQNVPQPARAKKLGVYKKYYDTKGMQKVNSASNICIDDTGDGSGRSMVIDKDKIGLLGLKNLKGRCIPCLPGTQYNAKNSKCDICKVGYSTERDGKNNYNKQSGICKKCAKGYYQDKTTEQSCKPCPKKKFARTEGQSICCPAGNGYKKNACTKCKVGYSTEKSGKNDKNNQGSKCIPCAKGYYQDKTTQQSCKQCRPGTYQTNSGQDKCIKCSPGTHQKGSKGTNCEPCDEIKGYYQNKAGEAGCKRCTDLSNTLSTGKKCLNKREIYLEGKITSATKDNVANWRRQTKFKCPSHLVYLKKYSKVSSAEKCRQICWKDSKCELSLYKGSSKSAECYNKTTNYKNVSKKNGIIKVQHKNFKNNYKEFSNICQNPAVKEKGKYLGLEGKMWRGHAGWEKNENKNEFWDRLFFKPVN